MITVQILINGKVVIARSARNLGFLNSHDCPEDMCRYHTDDGSYILHQRSRGAVELAYKMLAGVREP